MNRIVIDEMYMFRNVPTTYIQLWLGLPCHDCTEDPTAYDFVWHVCDGLHSTFTLD